MFWNRSNKVLSESTSTDVREVHFSPGVLGAITVTDKELTLRLRYHDLREETLGVLAAALPLLEPALPSIASHLAEKVRSRPALWAQINKIPGSNRAEEEIARHLASILSGRITPDCVKRCRGLGKLFADHQIDVAWLTGLTGYVLKLTLDELTRIGVPVNEREQFTLILTNRLAAEHALVTGEHEKVLRGKIEERAKAVEEERDEFLKSLAADIREAARVGDLTSRSDLKRFPGYYKDAAQAVNDLLDSILVPLREAINVLQHVKRRDLTARITGEYEGDHRLISEALNPALDHLNTALAQVEESILEVELGANKVADASGSLSSGATEQASSLEEIRSTMDEVTARVRQNSEGAMQASKLAGSAREHAESGSKEMSRMLDAMHGIEESSGQISRIIKVIEEIAFQTNLLSLNAAVEAARAGVHGKGFAVVADEVRNLAQRSAKAAKETTDLIEGTIDRVKNGAKIAGSTSEALTGIVGAVEEVTSLIKEIAESAREQTHGIEQVNDAIEQIEGVTHHTAANAEEGASVAQQLSAEAIKLKEMIAQFKINGSVKRRIGGVQAARRLPSTPGGSAPVQGPKRIESPNPTPPRKAATAPKAPSGSGTNGGLIDLDDTDFKDF